MGVRGSCKKLSHLDFVLLVHGCVYENDGVVGAIMLLVMVAR